MWASCPTRRETAGDFTIAPWKRSRSAGIGYACERGPLPSAAARLPPVSLRLGPAAALTCHRHVIHYRGARFARPKGKAFFLCAARDYILPLRGRRSDQGIAPYAGCRHRIKQRRGGACPSRMRSDDKCRGRGKPLLYGDRTGRERGRRGGLRGTRKVPKESVPKAEKAKKTLDKLCGGG